MTPHHTPCHAPRKSLTSPHLLLRLWCLSVALLLLSPRVTQAKALLELSGGLAQPLGSELESALGGGGQLWFGLGGRPSWAAHGSAVYGYLSTGYDQLSQRGPKTLGAPLISREQLSLGLGVRSYWLIAPQLRMWAELGVTQLFENALLELPQLEPFELSASAPSLALGVGLQYKIKPRVLLSLGYQLVPFGAQDRFALIEQSARVPASDAAWGRGKLSLGIGVYF